MMKMRIEWWFNGGGGVAVAVAANDEDVDDCSDEVKDAKVKKKVSVIQRVIRQTKAMGLNLFSLGK